jgi:small subunit ribosomal protein S1
MVSISETFEEGYWRSLLSDHEALIDPSPATLRADRFTQSDQLKRGDERPIDLRWSAAEQACHCDEIIDVQVTGFNRGGLLIDWSGLHGFVPASHLVGFPATSDEAVRRQEFDKRVGQCLRAKVVEVDRPRGRFVVSERLAYNDRSRLELLLHEIHPGQKRCGVITTVCDFGAFVDLGGVEGLAHISEISWGRINHPAEVLHCGQTVSVMVMQVDCEQKRVALSLKRLRPDPWEQIDQRYAIDRIVAGVITTVVDFGAFVKLEEGVEGLIHITELAEGNFLHPNNVVHEGETVQVRVLNIDPQHRRLGLSLRRANE